MGFSTLNESNLHKSLKLLYCEQTDGTTEFEKNGYVYDIVTKDNQIIEIQTKNLAKLLSKILNTIDTGTKVKLVHPVVLTTRIELYSENGELISKRKSPKKGCIYDVFKELTGIYPLFTNPNFTLELVEINMIEERIRTEEPVQAKNNRRRFKRNWYKQNKRLDEISGIKTFTCKEDYLSLLPQNLPVEFCAKDLCEELKKNKDLPARISKNAHLIMWVYKHAGFIEETKIEKRSHFYKISK